MLVFQKQKKLVLGGSNASRVLAVIPTAKVFEYRGRKLVAVPHRLDEVKVLRNLGLAAPAPISHYYEWSGPYTPFAHQRTTAEVLTLNHSCFVLNNIGSGKTLSALWAADYLMSTGALKRMIIAAPLSTLERVWADEIYRHFPHRDFVVLHGAAATRRKLLERPADFYIVNHHGLAVLHAELAARRDIDGVLLDELAEFRNAGTRMWKSAKDALAGRKWRWGMTGSPTPRAPSDAWAQCRLIAPDRVPRYFGAFRDKVMRQVTPYKWLPRPEALHVVREAMQPAVLFTRDECLDLPPCTFSTRHVEMSPEQQKAYKEMFNTLRMEHAQGAILAVNEGVKAMKLVQIAAGVVYSPDGDVVLPNERRVQAVLEVIEQAEGKVIVYVPLTGGLHRIKEEVEKAGHSVRSVNGSTPKRERDEVFSLFQQDNDEVRVLVAHPQCMAHGLTLTKASVIVWYIPTNNYAIYEQACGRITRQGQTMHQHVIHLEGCDIERRMYARLEKKGSVQGALLDAIKASQEVT